MIVRSALGQTIDPTVYPAEDRIGETEWHRAVCMLLWQLTRRWIADRGIAAHVGSNQFVYWAQHEPTRNVAPDLYVIPDLVAPPHGLDIVKTWEHGTPSFALEVVSTDWRKDYEQAPPRYDEMGVRELVVYDAEAPRTRTPERCRFQVFRRVARRGLVRVEHTNADRIRSKVLSVWLREVHDGEVPFLRVASGPEGNTVLQTPDEEIATLRAELAKRR